jgi:hypothetical protein
MLKQKNPVFSTVIRAVVDPESIRDAESHFTLGSDNHGMLHVLHAYISRRRFFIVGAEGR